MDLFSSVGTQEILMILLVAIIVIGPTKIVEFGKGMGKFTRNIRQAGSELTNNPNKELAQLELEKKEHDTGAATESPKED